MSSPTRNLIPLQDSRPTLHSCLEGPLFKGGPWSDGEKLHTQRHLGYRHERQDGRLVDRSGCQGASLSSTSPRKSKPTACQDGRATHGRRPSPLPFPSTCPCTVLLVLLTRAFLFLRPSPYPTLPGIFGNIEKSASESLSHLAARSTFGRSAIYTVTYISKNGSLRIAMNTVPYLGFLP